MALAKCTPILLAWVAKRPSLLPWSLCTCALWTLPHLHPKSPVKVAIPLHGYPASCSGETTGHVLHHRHFASNTGVLHISPGSMVRPLATCLHQGCFASNTGVLHGILHRKQPHAGICFKRDPFPKFVCKRSPFREIFRNLDVPSISFWSTILVFWSLDKKWTVILMGLLNKSY